MSKWQNECLRELREQLSNCNTVSQVMAIARHVVALSHQEWLKNGTWPHIQSALMKLKIPPKHVAVVDLSQVLHAMWHVEPDRNKLFDSVMKRLDTICKQIGADKIVYACDSPSKFRSGIFGGYKASRDEKPPEFIGTERKVREQLAATGAAVIEFVNYESDDIMASIATTGAILGYKVTLATSDRDLWQVLGPAVRMWAKGKYYDRNDLDAEHGITPTQSPDWMAMVGKNDVPGLKGIGPKYASNLLKQYGDVQGILDAYVSGKELPKAEYEEFGARYWKLRPLYRLSKTLDVEIW